MTTLITGANRGIGAALADLYDARGETVIRTTRADVDLTSEAQIAAFGARMADTPIDLLVLNAGIYLEKGLTRDDYTADHWAKMFAVNVTGQFLMLRALLPSLRAAKGKVAILGSKMGSTTRAPGGAVIYRATKAAVLNMGRNMASDLSPVGIAIGIYHPGWVQTDMGGAEADIDVATSTQGLIQRFDALSMDTTGCFESYDGTAIPF